MLIVSHDRFLLDRVADHIAEIEDTRLRQFDGNYTAYQQKKAAENAMMLKRAETIARERARLQESIQRLFSFRQFTRMRSLQKQLYQIGIHHPARRSGKEPHGLSSRGGRVDVKCSPCVSVRKRYTAEPLLEDVSFSLWRGERVALIGPNGCGKTTLLRLLMGDTGAGWRRAALRPPGGCVLL